MDFKELQDLTHKTLMSISGADDYRLDYFEGLLKMFCVLENDQYTVTTPDSVIKKTMSTVAQKYSGKTKYPQKSFWFNERKYHMRTWNRDHGVDTQDEKEKENLEDIRNWAKAESEKYNAVSQSGEGENIVSERRKGMLERLKKSEVLITMHSHPNYQKWVSKESADKSGLKEGIDYYNPTHYLNEAEDMGRYGTIKK